MAKWVPHKVLLRVEEALSTDFEKLLKAKRTDDKSIINTRTQ
jgi:hypothetical protein